jgi:2-dehydro-3-deoxyphosphogluconate aldolase / (4S)-4-hydroxy-2-oxoglutarate aldolase
LHALTYLCAIGHCPFITKKNKLARFSRIQVALKMHETGIVPLLYHPDFETMKNILHACYDGGVRVFELTNRGDYAHELFAALNKYAATALPEMILGAGTIFDGPTAALYMQLGANFIVAPALHDDTARVCNRRKVLWVPGVATLSEISRAEELGAEVVKIFPGEVLGPEFVKGLKGPMPWTSIMVTGGVKPTPENLKIWFDAGVTCVGMGSQLLSKAQIANRDWAGLTATVRGAVEFVKGERT